MNFNDLDREMRRFETATDSYCHPDLRIIARIDGRGFHGVTKDMEHPFDGHFQTLMSNTVDHLMRNAGFSIDYGYHQSDEISLLLSLSDSSFDHKRRKMISILAGEASGSFSCAFGKVASFDCRLSELPESRVVDYFSWRQADCFRNSLSTNAYWTLRKSGLSSAKATSALHGMSPSGKQELLFSHGVNHNFFPHKYLRGTGLYWEEYTKMGYNPLTKQEVPTLRKKLETNTDLPYGQEYRQWITDLFLTKIDRSSV